MSDPQHPSGPRTTRRRPPGVTASWNDRDSPARRTVGWRSRPPAAGQRPGIGIPPGSCRSERAVRIAASRTARCNPHRATRPGRERWLLNTPRRTWPDHPQGGPAVLCADSGKFDLPRRRVLYTRMPRPVRRAMRPAEPAVGRPADVPPGFAGDPAPDSVRSANANVAPSSSAPPSHRPAPSQASPAAAVAASGRCRPHRCPRPRRARAQRPTGVDQALSRRGKVTSRRMSSTAAAIGMATSAPMTPSNTPPSSTATTVTNAGTLTARPMILGTSR
ncbi:hypothetical protein B0I31_1203 [Saccharothrix carnea]|uniref:Uncharacterized protein n=1 Tax=Saccharothrix carnea TaxID=1280637 RepID=A0A2P8HZ59_SACCR|nr:hypothetical protein B0I31_1203 [Saccharothrix carnea]